MGRVLKILEVGSPKLKTISKKVDLETIKNDDFKNFLDDLKATLEFSKGYGISAPQVGVNIRVIVIEVKLKNRNRKAYRDMCEIPYTVMINPKITFIEKEIEEYEYEGCLSVPEIRGIVKRPRKIFLQYYNENGICIQQFVDGYFARLVQHECDHLDGIIFLDKVEKGTFATKKAIREYKLNE